MKTIIELFTRENITLTISAIALVISLYNWWYNFHHTKAKISFHLKSSFCHNSPNAKLLFLFAIIDNRSHLDVSISNITLIIGKKHFAFEYLPHNLPEKLNGSFLKSSGLPILISGLGSYGGYSCINLTDNPELIELLKNFDSEIKFVIATNRKKTFTYRVKAKDIALDCGSSLFTSRNVF